MEKKGFEIDSSISQIPSQIYEYDLSYKFLKKNIEKSLLKYNKREGLKKELGDLENIKYEYYLLQKKIDYDNEHINNLDKDNQKNRYNDIKPYKYNRVCLKYREYINASFIYIPSNFYFIATQAPTDFSINDFWDMVFEYDCKIIIMLCEEIEGGKIKSSCYWNSKNQSYKIKFNEKKIEKNIIQRNITISKNNEHKVVTQLQYIGWPDHGIPNINEAYPSFLFIRNFILNNKDKCPVIVHCSAGVGRTGTFISIFNVIYDILSKQNSEVIQFSIFNVVRKLKEMRRFLVQNVEQYFFIYQFIEVFLLYYKF